MVNTTGGFSGTITEGMAQVSVLEVHFTKLKSSSIKTYKLKHKVGPNLGV